jgi:hypothetical protein
MIWKGCGRKRWWPDLKYNTTILLEELRKIMKNLGRSSNTGLPEYEAIVCGVK